MSHEKNNSFEDIFGKKKAFLGMVHLRPTVGYPNHPGIDKFIAHAVTDATALESGGSHGICIENDRDDPHTILVTTEQEQCILKATQAVVNAVSIPVGVGVLLNDWRAALNIAKKAGCAYVRIDVFVDRVQCNQGIIEPEADAIIAYRKKIGAEHIAIFADIQVKHKILLEKGKDLITSAQQAMDAGAAAVTVTGTATGEETPIADVRHVKEAFPEFPVLIGAGVNLNNAHEQFSVADGAFVGSSLKTAEDAVDEEKVRAIISMIE